MGGSYAYGHGLKREQTFSYLLSNITKRPIYNFSNCGGFIWTSLDNIRYFIEINEDNINKLKNSEYVIYIYMHDHINRFLVINIMYNFYEYLISPKTNVFVKNILKIPVFRFLFIEQKINRIVNSEKNKEYINRFAQNSSKFLKNSILLSYEHIKEIAPKAKFIIIIYDEKMPDENGNLKIKYDSEVLNSHIWQEINNETDIEVIHTKDITGFVFDKDYKLKKDISDWHPNEKAWAVFTPKFAKKYIN